MMNVGIVPNEIWKNKFKEAIDVIEQISLGRQPARKMANFVAKEMGAQRRFQEGVSPQVGWKRTRPIQYDSGDETDVSSGQAEHEDFAKRFA
jgi:hypothetical protein